MTTISLERRVAVIEKKLETLTASPVRSTNKDWVLKMWGSFANDPDFEKAMRYGRQWRDAENRKSLRNGKAVRARKNHG